MNVPLLRLQHIFKKFNDGDPRGEIEALRDISFDVKKGEFITVLGPSGCGKSTLLRIIAGLIKPCAGQCLFKNEPISEPSLERGYVFQEPRLFPWLTVLENIRLAGGDGETLLKKMDLTGFGQALPHELSGGMARRVALARALAPKPDVLLLDEPLSNLDVTLRTSLQAELLRIWQEEKVTCILVTHNIEEALRLGTRMIILSRRPGQIKQDQPIDLPFPRERNPRHLQAAVSQIRNWMEE